MPDASTLLAGEHGLSLPHAGRPWAISSRFELKLVIGVVAAQLLFLTSMIVIDALPLVLGERVKLRVVPIDPRDLFRGDYVVLDYDFNRIEPGKVQGLSPSRDYHWLYNEVVGRDVYVPLTPQGDHHEAGGASIHPPAAGPFLHGHMVTPYRLECGIEAFYVQEGEGHRLENLIRQRRVLAEVAVWHGQAKLVRLVE
jgi:GDYXXLXY motif protein